VWLVFSARQVNLGAAEADVEDEDVTCERRRVSSDDVNDDVLVLQSLTKVTAPATVVAVIFMCIRKLYHVNHLTAALSAK